MKLQRLPLLLPLLAALWLPLLLAAAEPSTVSLRREMITLPTFPVGAPERSPLFYHGKVYQGAKGVIYPYPAQDRLSDEKVERRYEVLFLENEYVRIGVIPELGGRLFEAVDKTDGYDFFYRQHVVKPAYVGLLGAWVSGGVEWNVPHHHRASTSMPVDCTTRENPDGSKTIFVGETERRHRIKWLVGLTLHPGSSLVQCDVRIQNRSPLVESFLYWANVAVHADSNYQVFFPPSVTWGVGHGKHQYTEWPISHQQYSGTDYTEGVDVSWWKSHPSPVSIFAFEAKEDFVAGYDHGKRAGVVHVADHHRVPGKKLWEWGPGTTAQMWDSVLTDSDGPYIEIMTGAYSDNQPDYSWLQPGEVKKFTQSWYPLRELGGVKNANEVAALNLEVKDGKVRFGFNASERLDSCLVQLATPDRELFTRVIDLAPDRPFTAEVPLPAGVREEDLVLNLSQHGSRKKGFSPRLAGPELISYRPVKPEQTPMPEQVTPPPAPAELKSIEELYLAGMRLEQFHSAALEPDQYYEEALRRDPGDYRSNTALGILYLKRGKFEQAAELLSRAVNRVSAQHTRPRDGEALYYLGVALRYLGRDQAAVEAFQRAAWSQAWTAAASFQLAQLAAGLGQAREIQEQCERALAYHAWDQRAQCLSTGMSRDFDNREAVLREVLEDDPLEFQARWLLAQGDPRRPDTRDFAGLDTLLRGEVQNYLELATELAGFSMGSAGSLLGHAVERGIGEDHPLMHYYQGYYALQLGRLQQAKESFQTASMLPPDYVFPFRLEEIAILKAAIEHNPADSKAPYYLGNLLFDKQPEEAIRWWEKSVAMGERYPVLQRNLGLAYARVRGDYPQAIACLEQAIALDPSDPRFYLELDELGERAGKSPAERLAFLKKNQARVDRRDDLLSRQAELYVATGNYDRALEILENHHFHLWEGGGAIHGVFADAHLYRGQLLLEQGKTDQALREFRRALDYPRNLEVGRPADGGSEAEAWYLIGLALEKQGQAAQARAAFERALAGEQPPSRVSFRQGLAGLKLGRGEQADQLFAALVTAGRRQLEDREGTDFFAKFGERQTPAQRAAAAHYLVGLGLAGQGKDQEARAEFKSALGQDPFHPEARWQLDRLGRR